MAHSFTAAAKGAAVAAGMAAVLAGIQLEGQQKTSRMRSGDHEIPFDDSMAGMGDPVDYSNKAHQEFVDKNQELKRLSPPSGNVYADGSVPHDGYYSENGELYRSIDNRKINGVRTPSGDIYLSKSAFVSSQQLYMTTHHEFMHAYFNRQGFGFNTKQQHKIIDGWHYDQYYQWKSINQFPDISLHYNSYGNISRWQSVFGLNYYGHFGFKIINYIP